jgi:hypothetical protein
MLAFSKIQKGILENHVTCATIPLEFTHFLTPQKPEPKRPNEYLLQARLLRVWILGKCCES